MENEKGKSYTGSKKGIRNSDKALWETDTEIGLGLDNRSITALFTWNSKWIWYEKKEPTIPKPKKTGWCSLLWHFLPVNNVGPESKRKIKLTIIMIISIKIMSFD